MLANRMPFLLWIIYVIFQFLGALAALFFAYYIVFPDAESIKPPFNEPQSSSDRVSIVLQQMVLGIFLFTIFLYVTECPHISVFSAIAIGAAIIASSLGASTLLTGISLNPNIPLSMAVKGQLDAGEIWVYVIGTFLGALLAAVLYWIFKYNFNSEYLKDTKGRYYTDECGNTYMKTKVKKQCYVDGEQKKEMLIKTEKNSTFIPEYFMEKDYEHMDNLGLSDKSLKRNKADQMNFLIREELNHYDENMDEKEKEKKIINLITNNYELEYEKSDDEKFDYMISDKK